MRRDHHQCADETLCSLMAGELSPWQAWRVRNHIAACPECRASFERTRQLWTSLQGLAAAPPPDSAQSALERNIDEFSGDAYRAAGRKQAKKKQWILAGCAGLALLSSAAYAEYRLDQPTVFTCYTTGGPVWRCTTQDAANVQILNAQDQQVANVSMEPSRLPILRLETPRSLADARFVIDVAGMHDTVVGPGPHAIRDEHGKILGTVVVSAFSRAQVQRMQQDVSDRMPEDFNAAVLWAQRQESRNGSAGAGVNENIYTNYGYDPDAGVTWITRGQVRESMICSTGQRFGIQEGPSVPVAEQRMLLGYAFDPSGIAVPKTAITVGGTTHTVTGYGRQIIHGAKNIVVTLEIKPERPTQPED